MFSNIKKKRLLIALICLQFIVEVPGFLPNETKNQEKANQMKKSSFERR